MATNGKEMLSKWNHLRTATLDDAPDLVSSILSLGQENNVLLNFVKSGKSGEHYPSEPPQTLANRIRAGAYQRMASEKYRQAETLPSDSFGRKALINKAKEYEEEASTLWQAGRDVAPTQEVAHV